MFKVIDGASPSQRKVVLVVDDEPLIRLGIATHLEENGFRVEEAADASDAIAIMQTPGQIVDLVFSDVRMPGEMDGIGLSKWIFENRPGIAVILASGDLGKACVVRELCEADTIRKPYDYVTATDRIHAALTRKAVM